MAAPPWRLILGNDWSPWIHCGRLCAADCKGMADHQPKIVHLDWDLNHDNDDHYKEFITSFCQTLADNPEHRFITDDIKMHDWLIGHILLPREAGDKPIRWMYINVSLGSSKSTTLVIRDDNVYLMGFMNKDGKIYEFGENGRSAPSIRGDSTFLGYDSSYGELFSDANVSEVSIDRNSIAPAVEELSRYGMDDRRPKLNKKKIKRNLGKLVLMICEAARMYQHLAEADRGWRNHGTITINKQLFGYLRNWKKMSRAVITNQAHDFACLEGIGVQNRNDALKIVHLIKYHPLREDEEAGDNEPREAQPDQPAPQEDNQPGQPPGQPGAGGGGQHPQQQPPQSPSPAPQQEQQGQQRQHKHHSDDGRPLMEVFSLRAKNPVLGTIAIFDGKRGQVIYKDYGHADADAPRKVTQTEENLVLTGPYRPISADGRVAMKHYAVPQNDSSGQFSNVLWTNTFWDYYTNNKNMEFLYDKLLSKEINADLHVSYAVLSRAEEATLQVDVLPSMHNTGVYGEITAHTKLLDGTDVSILLFSREKVESLNLVKSFAGSTIPLARSRLAWGFDSPLVIKVRLQATSPILEGTSTSTIAAPFQGTDFSFDDHADKIILEPIEGIGYVRLSINVTGKQLIPGLLTNEMDPAMCVETDYLVVRPRELRFTFEPDKQMTCLLHVTNDTDDEQVAFRIRPVKESSAGYFHRIREVCGILSPNTTSTYLVSLEGPRESMDELDDIILESCIPPKEVKDVHTSLLGMRLSLLEVKDTEDVDSSFLKSTGALKVDDIEDVDIVIDDCFRASDEIDKHLRLKVNVCDPADKTTTSQPIRQGIKLIPFNINWVDLIDLHPTEPWVLVSVHVGWIGIWNYETAAEVMPSAELKDINQNRTHPLSIKFIAREQWFIAGDSDGNIHVYTWATDPPVMKEVRKFKAHEKGSGVSSLAVHPSKPLVLSSSSRDDHHAIKLWNWKADDGWECIQTFDEAYSHKVVGFNPFGGNAFASLSSWGYGVQMWNISPPRPVATLDCPREDGRVTGCDYFSTGGGGDQLFMVTGSETGIGRIWDLKNNRCITQVEGLRVVSREEFVWCSPPTNVGVVQSHDGRPILLTVSKDHVISLYDCITYRCQRTIDLKLGKVDDILYAKSTGSLVIKCEVGLAVMDLDEISFSNELKT